MTVGSQRTCGKLAGQSNCRGPGRSDGLVDGRCTCGGLPLGWFSPLALNFLKLQCPELMWLLALGRHIWCHSSSNFLITTKGKGKHYHRTMEWEITTLFVIVEEGHNLIRFRGGSDSS